MTADPPSGPNGPEHGEQSNKPPSVRRWAGLAAATAALAVVVTLIVFSVLDALAMPTAAQQTCPDQSVPAGQIGHAGPGRGTLAAKIREGQNEEVDFGRSITARTLTLYLAMSAPATGARYFSIHADPFTRTDDATLANADILTRATSDGNTLIVTVCFIREKAGLSLGDPGSYTGSVTLDDSRLGSAVTIPVTVTMQYVHGMLLIWLYVAAVLPGIWCLWVLKTSRDGREPAISREIFAWLRTVNGAVSVAAGSIAALSVYIATYLRDPTWGSSTIQPLALYGAMFSAFVTTAGLAQLAHPSSQLPAEAQTTDELSVQAPVQAHDSNQQPKGDQITKSTEDSQSTSN
jgi:hypothetical protein